MKKKEKAFIQSTGEEHKSLYRKPCIQVLEIELHQLVATSLTLDDDEEVSGYYGVRERRGTWGNLWEEEEE